MLSHLTGKVQTACLVDADLVLLSRIDDAFSLAENGKIVSSRDGQRLRTYGEGDRIYSDCLPGVTLPYWRPLDLTAAPFSLPDPTEVANEGCDAYGGAYADKSLAVWKVAEIAAAVERNFREWQYG